PIMQSCTENNASLRAAGTRHGNVWPPKTQTVLGCRAILTTEHRYGGVAMPINENLEPSDEEVRTVHDFLQFMRMYPLRFARLITRMNSGLASRDRCST